MEDWQKGKERKKIESRFPTQVCYTTYMDECAHCSLFIFSQFLLSECVQYDDTHVRQMRTAYHTVQPRSIQRCWLAKFLGPNKNDFRSIGIKTHKNSLSNTHTFGSQNRTENKSLLSTSTWLVFTPFQFEPVFYVVKKKSSIWFHLLIDRAFHDVLSDYIWSARGAQMMAIAA